MILTSPRSTASLALGELTRFAVLAMSSILKVDLKFNYRAGGYHQSMCASTIVHTGFICPTSQWHST